MDKIPNKGLSTNDFTDGYKKKVDNFIEHEKGDSAYQLAVKNGFEGNEKEWLTSLKGDKGDIPVKGIDYFTEEEIQEIKSNILDQVNQFNVLVVEELPTDNIDDHTIYFVPKVKTEQNDVYDEFIYINNGWEHIGTTEVDLSSYYKKDEIDKKLEAVEGNEVFVGNEEEAPSSAKIIIEDEDFEESAGLSKAEIYVGAEEPTTGEKVWFRKGKNLLNYKNLTGNATNIGIMVDSNDNLCSTTTSDARAWNYDNSNWFIILPAGTYTISLEYSKQSSNVNAGIGIYSKEKQILFTKTVNLNNYNYTFTLEEETRVGVMMKIYDGILKIQLEQGSKATSCEAYIEPQIFVRNSNGVYEEFIKNNIKEISFTKNDANAIFYESVYATENEVQICGDIRYSYTSGTNLKAFTIDSKYLPIINNEDNKLRYPISTDKGANGYAEVNSSGEVYIHTNGVATAAIINIRYRYK